MENMKRRKFFTFIKRIRFPVWLNQRGQSLVEFVLLLVVVAGISYTFVAFMNRTLAKYWQYSVNLVIDDKPGTKTVRLD
jgi:hypothetical protein